MTNKRGFGVTKKESRVTPEIPTASMADIAFLLIVFFLVTTTMNQDKGLSLHLPPVGETKEVKNKNILNVWINARDQVAFFENDQLTPVPSAELKGRIESRLNENKKLIISVKTERGATYRTFVDVLDELKIAGATKISIANPEE
ncbi:MAG: biopolymer transporter ExbD [Candidatus Latescibacterota bacterium]|nr:biopolymer transporter ExbD [Candidatus Latescibacterota bacterium]